MAAVLLTKDQERQVRMLRFDRTVEAAYQEAVANERLRRIRIVMVLLVLLMLPSPKSRDVGPAAASWLTNAINVSPWILLAFVFVPKFKRAAVYALPVWSLLQLLAFGLTVVGSDRWTQTTVDLAMGILIVSAVRAPAKLAIVFSTLTVGGRIYFWVRNGVAMEDFAAPMMFLIFGFFFLAVGSLLTELADRRAFLVSRSLEAERERTQALLTNVLPAEIAEKLKVANDVIAAHHDEVTILFADIANFTPFSEGKTPAEVVGFLNQLFSRWDGAVERAGMTKIKTVGDAYMVGGGLPSFRADHVAAVADLALEMRGISSAVGAEVRFGIHTGPVVAGVIGTQRYTYDVWGSTVNMASRLQTHATSGEILVSASVRDALTASHDFGDAGTAELKGIGKVCVSVLLRRRFEPIPLAQK